jgi:hypothetical protein
MGYWLRDKVTTCTSHEALDLVHQLANALGVPTEYDTNQYLK